MNNDMSLFGMVLLVASIIIVLMVILFSSGIIMEQGTQTRSESFTVADPSSDQVCNLDQTPTNQPTVEYYDGTGWSVVSDAEFSLSGQVVTVDASAMD